MQTYTQTDPRWANQTYDGVNTYKAYGCFVTSLAMICLKLPTEVAQILRDNGCFTDGYINNSEKAAPLLGLEYNGKSTIKPNYDCIAETNYWGGQHFFVILADGTRVDPLASKHVNDYKIVSYRLFKAKESEQFMTYDLFRPKDQGKVYERLNNYALVGIPNEEFATKYYGADWGSKVQVVDDINAVGWIAEDPRPLKTTIGELDGTINTLKNQVSELTNKIGTKQSELDAINAKYLKEIDQLKKQLDEATQNTNSNPVDNTVTDVNPVCETTENSTDTTEPSISVSGLIELIKKLFKKG